MAEKATNPTEPKVTGAAKAQPKDADVKTKAAAKPKAAKRSRSAVTGKIVSADEAKKNPDTTVTETVKKEKSNPVIKAWTEKIGRDRGLELREVKAHDGREQTQIINEEGALVVAVNATGKEAEKILVENAGVAFLDDAFGELDLVGPNTVNSVEKGADVPTPSNRPGTAVEEE